MTKIYLVRHAEAEGNCYRRIHGQYDSLITQNGLRQIAALAQRFRDIPVDACYASDLYRTCKTSEAVYKPKNLPLHRDARFREVNMGVWEDRSFGDLERFEPETMRAFNQQPRQWHVEGSERFADYTGRFMQALHQLAERHDGQTITIFSHGCVLRGVQQLLQGSEQVPYCDNTAVSLLEYEDGNYHVRYLNDNSHLSEEISTFARQKWWRESDRSADNNLWFQPADDAETFFQAAKAFDAAPVEIDGVHTYAMLQGQTVGALQLLPEEGKNEKIGFISFLALEPSHRNRRLGCQLVGEAVSYYRARGRRKLRLEVAADNLPACRLFAESGFSPAVEQQTPGLLTLEKPIAVQYR